MLKAGFIHYPVNKFSCLMLQLAHQEFIAISCQCHDSILMRRRCSKSDLLLTKTAETNKLKVCHRPKSFWWQWPWKDDCPSFKIPLYMSRMQRRKKKIRFHNHPPRYRQPKLCRDFFLPFPIYPLLTHSFSPLWNVRHFSWACCTLQLFKTFFFQSNSLSMGTEKCSHFTKCIYAHQEEAKLPLLEFEGALSQHGPTTTKTPTYKHHLLSIKPDSKTTHKNEHFKCKKTDKSMNTLCADDRRL